MIPLQVPTRSRRCSKCDAVFKPGSAYSSLLTEEEERLDCCPDCKEEMESGIARWEGKIPPTKEKVDPKTKAERALVELKRCIQQGESKQAYVLGLYLQRLRYIKLVGIKQGRQRFSVKGGGTVSIEPVALSELQVESIQKDLADKLFT